MKKISSLQNPLVKHLVRLRHNSDYRDEHHTLVIEGKKVIEENHEKLEIINLLTTDENSEIQSKNSFYVTPEILEKISGVITPEGFLAEISMPEPSTLKGVNFLLALDGVQDPGNVGTLIRSALAFGWEGVFILENSCDPFNDKALRASKGAIFHLPYRKGNWSDLEAVIKKNQLLPFAADAQGENFENIRGKKKILLVLGNEGKGLSDEVAKHCKKIAIPMNGKTESLNVAVAGSILMYELSHE